MLKLKTHLKAWITRLLYDSHSALVALAMGLLLGGTYVSLDSVRIALNSALLSQTPLWASIALALIVTLYTYLKARSFQSPLKEKKKTAFFTTNKIKWKITIYKDNYFEVDSYPFCTEHDVQFITEGFRNKQCPGTLESPCRNHLLERDEFKAYSSVKSIVESKLRNGEKLC